ncbi:hypothetical protein F5Y01DRAFT_328100 [Xylaria sp. FL0043]|nr:hypothetical protein F5Y01DRAFT_328100 [Xylaria sp. FL0043]
MWARLLTPALPTPLHSEERRHKDARKRLLDEDERNARQPSPQKHTRYSIRPIFDTYKHHRSNDDGRQDHQLQDRRRNGPSPSPASGSPMIRKLKRDYAALRVTLHSNGAKKTAKFEEALVIDIEEKITANISKLEQVASRERELSTHILDCEIDTELNSKDGQKRTATQNARRAVSDYQRIETERVQQLAHLWRSWEKAQSNIDELSDKLHELFEREASNGRSGMSSNGERTDKDDFDIERRIKQVVEEMTACEDEFKEKLKQEQTNILQAIFESSLD